MKQLLRGHQVIAEPYGSAWEGAALDVLIGWMHDKKKVEGTADERACREPLAAAQGFGL